MSLNKFTDINKKKEWMNINCNEIKTDTLSVQDQPINPPLTGIYNPSLSFPNGGTLINELNSVWMKINKNILFNGSFNVILPTSGVFFSVTIPLPPNNTNISNNNFTCIGIGGGDISLVLVDSYMDNPTTLFLVFSRIDKQPFSGSFNAVVFWKCHMLSDI